MCRFPALVKVLPDGQLENVGAVKMVQSLHSPRFADLGHVRHPSPFDFIWFVRKFGVELAGVLWIEGGAFEAKL